jgi:hypothetical protein
MTRPTIADAARDAIIAAGLIAPRCEHVFACTYDDATATVTTARLVFRGGRRSARLLWHQFTPGDLIIHSHPPGCELEPSEADLDSAHSAGERGLGFGIVAPDASELFLVTTPAAVERRIELAPAYAAWVARIREWKWWRFTLKYTPGGKPSRILA